MSAKSSRGRSGSTVSQREKIIDEACAKAPSRTEADRLWAKSRIDDPQLMKRSISQLRAAHRAELDSGDADERRIAQWWCSEQRLRDFADSSSSFDGPDEDSFGGGPCIFHPDYGDRESLELVRDLVSEMRAAATSVFRSRGPLEAAYRGRVSRTILDFPPEEWADRADDWSESDWCAFAYKGGMRALQNVPMWMGHGNWTHALRMTLSAKDHLHSITRAELRGKLIIQERERRRNDQLAGFQIMGAKARRIYDDEERAVWAALFNAEFSHHSRRRAAELIAAKRGLPAQARASIRAMLSKLI
jgi:hypothetical protein